MKRPVVLIVGAAAGALLIAAIGASAHTGFSVAKIAGLTSAVSSDEASNTETPEPTETPDATEPAETPEVDADTDTDEDTDEDVETNDDNGAAAAATTTKKTESGDATEHKSTSGSTDEKSD